MGLELPRWIGKPVNTSENGVPRGILIGAALAGGGLVWAARGAGRAGAPSRSLHSPRPGSFGETGDIAAAPWALVGVGSASSPFHTGDLRWL